jgi:hypothetical protein
MVRVLRVVLAPRWLVRHLFVALVVATCYGFGRWQLGRAQSRHSVLNWSYTVEWSLFGAFALLVWGWYLRDDLRGVDRDVVERPPAPVYLPRAQPVSTAEDPELAAYNAYLASLNQKASLNEKDSA